MKRFTETTKWDDPWFLDLSTSGKLFWLYLCDKCDNAGVIHIHERKMHFELGISRSVEDLMGELGDRIVMLDNGKLHIPSFVPFQFGELKEASNLHKSVIQLLQKHGLPNPSSTLPEGYPKGPSKGKGKGKDTVKAKVEYPEQFDGIWQIYGLKGNKKAALKEWEKLSEEQKDDAVKAVPDYLMETPEKQFRKDFERYLSHRVFESVLERKASGTLNTPKQKTVFDYIREGR